MSSLRSYNFKSVDMLLASKAIVQSLSENLNELSAIRSNWTPEYVQQLSSKIDSAIDQFLDLDKKKALWEMTRKLFSIQVPAQRDLSFLKTQIEVDFGDQAPELLKTLGFYSYFENTTKGKQEAMIEMLSAFKKGFSDSLKQQLIDKGTSPDLLFPRSSTPKRALSKFSSKTFFRFSMKLSETFGNAYPESHCTET